MNDARRRTSFAPAAALVGVLALTGHPARTETIAGFTFPDGAFADVLEEATPSTGTAFTHEFLDDDGYHSEALELPADFATLESILVGSDLLHWTGITDSTATLTLGFHAPLPADGAGDDLVLFDIGFRESIAITIGDVTQTYEFIDSGEDIAAGGQARDLNYATIDLADFGVTSASSVVMSAVSGGEFDADVAAFGALNVEDVLGAPDPPAPSAASLTVWPVPYRAGPLAVRLGTSTERDGVFEVSLYDLQGRRVGTTQRGRVVDGVGEVRWDSRTQGGNPLAPGIYFARATTQAATHTRKVVVSR